MYESAPSALQFAPSMLEFAPSVLEFAPSVLEFALNELLRAPVGGRCCSCSTLPPPWRGFSGRR
eukprot:8475564-Pyramimonas_sp.AAC.1